MFKKDLSRAYRQLCIDPRDYHLLGYQFRDYLYFDTAPPFGLRSSAMMCQTTTSAVTFITRISATLVLTALTISGEQRIPTLSDLLRCLGLSTSPEKDSPPATSMVFLGVLVDIQLKWPFPSLLTTLHSRFASLLSVTHVSQHGLQSLLSVISLVTSCARLARVFMSSLLYTLRSYRLSKYCPLSSVNYSDIRWWCQFLPYYNGVSIIKTSLWHDDRLFLSTDACTTGAGGYLIGKYLHTPFPASFSASLDTT